MKFYIQVFKLLINKFIFRQNNGVVIKKFCEKMGIVYIKFAQILATQNYGNIFTENDRKILSSICDNCNPITYDKIESVLKEEYGNDFNNIFIFIDKNPIGSASISQVHRAILNNGDEVAIKVKRKDITDNIEKEIKRLKSFVHRFGRLFKFGNYTGGDYALDLFLTWIKEEIDFNHEKNNIEIYQKFAISVNNKLENNKLIKVPKLYKEYCNSNIIVMEFINYKTINKLELTEENNKKIVTALNSYMKASFWAMFNDEQIVFHGDPHSGNIYIDDDGNIGFLDMGLLFVLNDEDRNLIRKFFLTAYSGNYEKLYDILSIYGNMSEDKKMMFKIDCKSYCDSIKEKDVTYYFTDMINICLKYEFVPPSFLFCMAKAFVCLNGINNFSHNKVNVNDLLREQTVEYLLKRSLNDCKNIHIDSFNTMKRLLKNTLKYGIVKSIAKESSNKNILKEDVKTSLDNLIETIEIIKCS